MALNWVQPDPNNPLEPLLLPGERIINSFPDADIQLTVPATMEGPKKVEDRSGKVWVSNKRFVFIAYSAPPGPAATAAGIVQSFAWGSSSLGPQGQTSEGEVKSLSIPWSNILTNRFNQPLFSGNNILIALNPVQGGGLPTPPRGQDIQLKLFFKEGKIHEIWKLLEGCRERARQERVQEDTLPVYEARPSC